METTVNEVRAYCINNAAEFQINRDGFMRINGNGVSTNYLMQAASGKPQMLAEPAVPLQPHPDAISLQADGYEALALVLQRAFTQAAHGKGKERHAKGEPFTEQVMQQGAQRFGVGALLFQAFKKSEESQRLPLDRGVNELLGAIVYLAGAVIARERAEAPKPPAANDNADDTAALFAAAHYQDGRDLKK